MLTRVVARILPVILLSTTATLRPSATTAGEPVGSAFTYQGSVRAGSGPVSASYDFSFALFDAPIDGSRIGSAIHKPEVPVTSGVFSVQLDFGAAAYSGDARWLQIDLRPSQGRNDTNPFVTLPRQRLDPTPFASGLSLPANQHVSSIETLFSLLNTGTGPAASFVGSGTGAYVEGKGTDATGLVAKGGQWGVKATGAGVGIRAEGGLGGVDAHSTYGPAINATGENANYEAVSIRNTGGGHFIVARSEGLEGRKEFWVDYSGTTHTRVLEILGGSDLSERFDVSNQVQATPGTVVCIDPTSPGRLVVSQTAYDRRVAGIVSGAGGVRPGMLMGQVGSEADGACPVALTGRVYCLATAAKGPIRPGDLLTTSSIPGHAMRAFDHARAQGATLGKAMSSLAEGEGLVLVLVGLQ